MILDIGQVPEHTLAHIGRHFKAFGLGLLQRMGHMDGGIGDRLLASSPVREAAIMVLQALQLFDISLDNGLHFGRRRQAVSLKSRQHIS